MNKTFKPTWVQKFSRKKLHNALALPILIYVGAKFGPLREIQKRMISTAIKFSRIAAEYFLFYHRRNEEILKDLKVEPIDKKLRRYKSN